MSEVNYVIRYGEDGKVGIIDQDQIVHANYIDLEEAILDSKEDLRELKQEIAELEETLRDARANAAAMASVVDRLTRERDRRRKYGP